MAFIPFLHKLTAEQAKSMTLAIAVALGALNNLGSPVPAVCGHWNWMADRERHGYVVEQPAQELAIAAGMELWVQLFKQVLGDSGGECGR
jgi:hypothetical protein